METNKIFHLGDVNVSTYSDGSLKGFQVKKIGNCRRNKRSI